MQSLKLMALDRQDLTVIAAHMQDAITKPQYIDYAGKDRRFKFVLNRFAWDAEKKPRQKEHQRRQSLLSFGQVNKVRSRAINRSSEEQILSLLSVNFVAGQAPAGVIELVFADGPIIELDVECIEVQLADLGGAWQTRFKPRHPLA